MNPRIQELLTQSTYEILGVPQVDQKQFAELIIRECADYMASGKIPDGAYEAMRMLNHFGLEE